MHLRILSPAALPEREMLMKKPTLVFDVGNVLIGFCVPEVLAGHGMSREKIDRFFSCIFMDPLWAQLDLEIRPFWEVIGHYRQKYPDLADDVTWLMEHCDRIVVPRPAVWEEIRRLKEAGFPVYILSNYSSYFFDRQVRSLPFWKDVDGAVVSFQIHRIKPDPSIYQHLLDKYQLIPEDCLFFDDRKENTQAARDLGMQTFTVESEEQLLRRLRALG